MVNREIRFASSSTQMVAKRILLFCEFLVRKYFPFLLNFYFLFESFHDMLGWDLCPNPLNQTPSNEQNNNSLLLQNTLDPMKHICLLGPAQLADSFINVSKTVSFQNLFLLVSNQQLWRGWRTVRY